MILSGLLLNINKALSDNEIIDLLRLSDKLDKRIVHLSFDDLTSDNFNGLGIIKLPNRVQLVVHRNLGYTCSFEGDDLYGLDLRLQTLSENGEILCFMSNPYSSTFAFAYFKNGLRLANQAMAGGELLDGNLSRELEEVKLSENGILEFAERFGGFNFIDLIEFPKSEITAFEAI